MEELTEKMVFVLLLIGAGATLGIVVGMNETFILMGFGIVVGVIGVALAQTIKTLWDGRLKK